MKQFLIICMTLAFVFSSTLGFAGMFGQDQEQGQGQIQGQGQGQGQDQSQGQGQSMGQGQGQIGIVGQSSQSTQGINIDGDEETTEVNAFSAPALNAEKGTSSLNAYSPFGGIGTSETEEYELCIEKLAVVEKMEKAGYLTKEEAQKETLRIYEQLKETTKTKRLFGVLWKTRGRHLMNLMGLLSWSSFWK